MRSSIDLARKQFEADLLRELGMLSRLPQHTVLRIARERVDEILPLYNGDCSGKEAARIVFKLIDTERERMAPRAVDSAGWR